MNRTGLAWGIVFVMMGVFTLLVDLEIWASQPGWLWPLFLMALGAALLIGGLVPGRRGGRDV
jgi:uncharacterized membrane protein HdeD (DUF308 family)